MLLERKGMLSDTPFKLFLFLFCSFISYVSSYSDYANVSQSWINKLRLDHGGNYSFIEYSHTRTILFTNCVFDSNVSFGFGFVEQQLSSTSSLLCTYRQISNDGGSYPLLIWCANRDHPVQENATLDLTSQGDLVLRDADGSFVWSTNTSGHSVKYMNLTRVGSLNLYIANNVSIWVSSDYPTDTISPLYIYDMPMYDDFIGKKLTSSISSTNYCTGIYTVSFESDGLHAYVDLNIPQQYYFSDNQTFIENYQQKKTDFGGIFYIYMRLEPDGKLNLYDLSNSTSMLNIFEDGFYATCTLETCGDYGICFSDSKCYCPMRNDGSLEYFKPKDVVQPSLGCSRFTSLSCPDTNNLQSFLELVNVTYFDTSPFLIGKDVESCKRKCLSSCSCKAVIFHYYDDPSSGNCTLPSEIHTLMDVSNVTLNYNTNAYIKVQNTKLFTTFKRKLLLYVSVSLAALIFFIGVCLSVLIRRRKSSKDIDFSDDINVDTVSRFSFESLKLATQDFKTRLGRGGFGTVFEGTLEDGTKVAVKQLNSSGQGRKEFLAEVNTIGSLHHFNLVRLIGYCDDGFNRLLVYEYMCNGSLEKWIFNTDMPQRLAWNIRRSIINGVASGLEYLHEHCKQNVIHFDIKPQNILLDKDFNIKISDFGLAKMVDRDQSHVLTIIRGTPGYIAPELISGHAISVKVDVYSFGVVVLEIVCGRKNFGSSEGDCLTNLVKAKADLDQLTDVIDEHDPDMQQNKEEMVKMMKIAIWCLQPHFIRPTMSMVVKVLQDLPNMEAMSDLSYLTMYNEAAPMDANRSFSVRPIDSILSGPR
ncbi:unnamed protein product [Amaranthus hypochondriacus]